MRPRSYPISRTALRLVAATVEDGPVGFEADSRQVLVLDDDPVSLAIVEHALVSAGLEVTTAGTAVDAMMLARRNHYDLVVADYYLPDYPGTDFIRLMRQCDEYRDVPVILLTGRADELDGKRLRDDLFVLLLAKGCSSEHLLLAVFKCLAAVRCLAWL
ncbi:MAG: response regulator [Pirellulales bacterium]|nr:response regulator [Pirellulales bacterium]